MALYLPLPSRIDVPKLIIKSDFLPPMPLSKPTARWVCCKSSKRPGTFFISITSAVKLVRDTKLDKHVVKQNKIRFVQKLKTLLLSKPKHFMPIRILYKCRSYLSLPKPRSILSMIHRYPTIFELFTVPRPPTPMNATEPLSQLCVRLTPAAASLAARELNLKSAISVFLAIKLQKLLMLSSHHRLLLSKLVHIAPDLGLPPNFRSRLCNDYPDRFKTVETSFGRALELVSWDQHLANTLPSPEVDPRGLIVDRPLKFKHLRLRKGLNVKRRHHEFLIKFGELPDVCPYKTKLEELAKESIEAEKRSCAAVREVLGMMIEKRTLIDHLTHFRKEFGLPNKLRSMLVRHPDMFYVSLKGQRDSVFLVEAYDDKGALLEKDKSLEIRSDLMKLVAEGKKLRRERRKAVFSYDIHCHVKEDNDDYNGVPDDYFDDYDDGLDDLFEHEDSDADFINSDDDDDESADLLAVGDGSEFWISETKSLLHSEDNRPSQPW